MNPRRHFRSGSHAPTTLRSTREKRELVISLAIVAGLQLAIAVTLVVAALQTYHMWRQGVRYIPAQVARVVPVFLLLGAAIALFAASRTVRRVRILQRTPIEPPAED